jgi:polyphosphate kinase 2 (PPK2 family)
MGDYKQSLRRLRVELVKFQRHLIESDHRILILFEGRDAAGKDGVEEQPHRRGGT